MNAEKIAMLWRNRSYRAVSLISLAIAVGVVALVSWPSKRNGTKAETLPIAAVGGDDESAPEPMSVQTLRPKKDKSFSIAIQQLAWVRGYRVADVKSRAPGAVLEVMHVIGDTVKKGDLLAEIDVPDMIQDVAQKASLVDQRKQEKRLAEAKIKSAQAWIDAATAEVAQRRAGIVQADATTDYRKKRLDRYRELLKRQAISEDLVDEQEKEWTAAVGASQYAVAALQKAEADLAEKRASLETSQVDVNLKEAQIEVAKHDLNRTKELANYAKIVAPFDGVILKRNIDKGDFVQNASGGGAPLLTIARVDLVTIVSKVPDNAAPFITTETPVEIQIDQLPDVSFQGTISRFSPSIEPTDRTMRVEVDIINCKNKPRLDELSLAEQKRLNPRPDGMGDRKFLFPGMNGYMRLKLDELGGARLVPSSVILSRGGKQFLMLAEDGKAKLVPIYVQVNDGKLAKVGLLRRDSSGRDVRVELTGNEEIVASRQAELENDQAIRTNLKDW